MRCKKTQVWLQGYVDGELSPRQMKRVRHHLDKCVECATLLTGLSELKTLMAENRTQPEMEAQPEFFWSQLEGRIKGEAQPRQAWVPTFTLFWPRVLASVTVCLVAGTITALVWMQTWPKPQEFAKSMPARIKPAVAKVEQITTPGPEIYAEAYHSKQSQATIIWTEGMPVISLEL